MHPGKSAFKVFSVGVVLAVLLSVSPQNVSGKPINLNSLVTNVVQLATNVGGKVASEVNDIFSKIHINLSFGNAPASSPAEVAPKATAEVNPDKDTEVKSPSGKVTLKIPAGAVTKQTDITFVENNPQGDKSISLQRQRQNIIII